MRDFIVTNADFYGLDDPGSLSLGVNELRVTAQGQQVLTDREGVVSQVIDGRSFYGGDARTSIRQYEVPMTVYKYAPGARPERAWICTHGHLWPNARLPLAPLISGDEIRDGLVSQQHVFFGTYAATSGVLSDTSKPATVESRQIDLDDLDIRVVATLFRRSGQLLEVRLAHYAAVKEPGIDEWLVDAITGEILDPS